MSWSRVLSAVGAPGRIGGPILSHARPGEPGRPSAASQHHGHSGEGGSRRQPRLGARDRRHGRAGVLASASVVADPAAPPAQRRPGWRRFARLRRAAAVVRRPHARPGRSLRLGRRRMVPMMRGRREPAHVRTRGLGADRRAGRQRRRPAPTPRRPGSTSPTSPRPTAGSSYGCAAGGRLVITDVTGSAPRQLSRLAAAGAGVRRRPAARRRPRAAPVSGRRPSRRDGDATGGYPGRQRQHRAATTSTSPTRPTRGSTATPPGRAAALAAAVRRHGPPGHHAPGCRAAVRAAAPGQLTEHAGRRGATARSSASSTRGLAARSDSESTGRRRRLRRGLPPDAPGPGPDTVAVSHLHARRRASDATRWPSPAPAARSTPRPTGSTSPRPTGSAADPAHAAGRRQLVRVRSRRAGRAPTSTPSPSTATAPATSPPGSSTAPSATAGPSTSTTATSASPSRGTTAARR